MTITLTISTLATLGTLVNAADVTTPDNQLLAHMNNVLNGSQSAEQVRYDVISTPSTPASNKFKFYFKTAGPYFLDSSGNEISLLPAQARCDGRLTLQSGAPVTSSDVTAATSLYFTPWLGNHIAIYTGSAWKLYTFSELTLALTGLAANTNFDVFIYDNAGTLTLETTAWTNDTTRATALTTQDGVYVRTGATTRRYLGTIRTTGTIGQCEDSFQRRLVWNMYNKVSRRGYFAEATSHSYTTGTWRAWNNSAANQMDFVVGILDNAAIAISLKATWGTTNAAAAAAGLNQATTPSTSLDALVFDTSNTNQIKNAVAVQIPALGYNYIRALEFGAASITFASIYISTFMMN